MKNYIRENIQRLDGYTPGFQPKETDVIKLNTNENPYPPSPLVLEAIRSAANEDLKKYPDATADDLRDMVAITNQVSPGEVIIGNGSDEILSIIIRSVIGEGDKLVIADPTYTLFNVLAKVQDASIKVYPLEDDFSLPVELTREKARLVFVPRPNAQTGTCFMKDKLETIALQCGGILLIDEAYADFADDTCIDLYRKYDNIVLTRSFSKSYSLAGMRIGYAIARPELIEEFMKVKDSYNINRLSIIAGVEALKDRDYFETCSQKVLEERSFLGKQLRKIGLVPYQSQANFILAQSPEYPAKTLFEQLKERKILVRYFDHPRLKDSIRISIGTHKEMVVLVKEINNIIRGN